MELDIWLGGERVAFTEERDRGRRVRICYDAATGNLPPEVPLLSCSLPTPGPSGFGAAGAFLEGLLPEGRALEAMAAGARGVRLEGGAPATARDVVALLSEYGRECAGAVALLPRGEPFVPDRAEYQAVVVEDIASLLSDLPRRPLGADPASRIRMSLAGAQPKLLLARFGDRWFLPLEGSATTHILKPTGQWPHSAYNEALVMSLARAAGLTRSASWVEEVDGIPVLFTERYDRRVTGDRVQRSHQEDMCQALSFRPGEKYHMGRPSERMARLLRRLASGPAVEALFQQVCFRVLVGDEDGHGKNYSVLLDGGEVAMAPLYDCFCTLIYPELGGRMGTPVGRHTHLAGVDRAALLEEAAAMGIPSAEAKETLARLAGDLRRGIEDLDDSVASGWPSHQVTEMVLGRIERLESGRPLGEAPPGSRRSRAALDMTAQTSTRRRRRNS